MNPVLKTDAYEITMLSTLVEEGLADQPATFELFARRLPRGRRFGLFMGLGRFLEAYPEWHLGEAELSYLQEVGMLTSQAREWLERREKLFTGDLLAYPEGEAYWAHSPVVRVQGTLGEGLLLETLLLSMVNHDTAVASAAARMVVAAQGRPLIEMGSRRTHDEAALAAARAAYGVGFASTSNLAAGKRYSIPVAGTAAHAFILAHEDEEAAFKAQMETWGVGTTLLVDTYSIEGGLRKAVAAAQALGASGPGAVRLDSGDLLVEAQEARKLLDSLGATSTRIVVSSDLDEYLITELAAAPIDGYGAGTRVVTGSGHPTAGFVYKVVEVAGRPVAKHAEGKGSRGGVKTAYRREGQEYYSLTGHLRGEALQETYIKGGRLLAQPSLEEVRARSARSLAALPREAREVSEGLPPVEARLDPEEEA